MFAFYSNYIYSYFIISQVIFSYMFINNKKFLGGLVGLTLLSGLYFAYTMPPMPIPVKQLEELSTAFNQNLPLNIDQNTSLIKTSVRSDGINYWVFSYLIKQNIADLDLKKIDNNALAMVKQACTTEPTKEVLKHSTVITYQFFTLDKQMLKPLHILPRDCHTYWDSK